MPLLAVDCSQASITLDSQASVDDFQTNYGGGDICDRVIQNLIIQGDMTNLGGLSALTSIGHSTGILIAATGLIPNFIVLLV